MSTKKSRAVPHEVTVKEDRKDMQSSLKAANDAPISASSAFPISMIDNILPFHPPCDLFIFMTTIKIIKNI